MSNPRLPVELLDHITDFLDGEEDVLKSCCLVAKAWIPRSRKHLFAHIAFHTAENLHSWRTTFPDIFASPAHYTRSLLVRSPQVFMDADAGDEGWIPTFSKIAHLEVVISGRGVNGPHYFPFPFNRFSPAIKSLRVNFEDFPLSRISDLVRLFPRLQDLGVTTNNWFGCSSNFYKRHFAIQPSSSLAFTGDLKLSLKMGMKFVAPRLLSVPGGLHFRKLRLTWHHEEDVQLTVALVEMCSSTLETLKIKCKLSDELSCSIDLSRVIKLKEVAFVCQQHCQWVTTILRTIASNHGNGNVRQISLRASNILGAMDPRDRVDPTNLRNAIGETIHKEWLELDRLLVHLWESRSIQLRVMYNIPVWIYGQGARICMESLFPEVTMRGAVELVELRYEW